jgi:hypothetical protein
MSCLYQSQLASQEGLLRFKEWTSCLIDLLCKKLNNLHTSEDGSSLTCLPRSSALWTERYGGGFFPLFPRQMAARGRQPSLWCTSLCVVFSFLTLRVLNSAFEYASRYDLWHLIPKMERWGLGLRDSLTVRRRGWLKRRWSGGEGGYERLNRIWSSPLFAASLCLASTFLRLLNWKL